MRVTRRWFWATALVPLSLLITGGIVYAAHATVRWDIVSINFGAGTISAGGIVLARGLWYIGSHTRTEAKGLSVVSCSLVATPDSVGDGITATKGSVNFWNREAPVPGVDADRTLFHISPYVSL